MDPPGSEPSPDPGILLLPLHGQVAANAWLGRGQATAAEDLGRLVVLPEWGVACDEGFLVADDQADEIYPSGSRIGCATLDALDAPLRHGDRVLIRRRRVRDGAFELTVREIVEIDGGALLVYRSRRSDLQETVPLPWPQKGAVFEANGERLRVCGRITLAVLVAG